MICFSLFLLCSTALFIGEAVRRCATLLSSSFRTPTHAFVPFLTRSTALFVGEAINTLRKRVRSSDDVRTWLDSKLYPDYYLNSFHYQVGTKRMNTADYGMMGGFCCVVVSLFVMCWTASRVPTAGCRPAVPPCTSAC